MMRRRVLIVGLGDMGVLTAIQLSRRTEVVGVSAKPGLLSGQELGWRLTRPAEWSQRYWVPFDRYRAMDRVRTVHGVAQSADLAKRTVAIAGDSGDVTEHYDALVIASGVRNGFWRQPTMQSRDDVAASLRAARDRLAAAATVSVIGGGASAMGAAAGVAATWPAKRVDLYFPGSRALTGHHETVWQHVAHRLRDAGVALHAGHRAVVPDDFFGESITSGPIHWSTGQPTVSADAAIWATGRVKPNTEWLPGEVLDEGGFVRVTDQLEVPGHRGVFAVGDVAASDPARASARARGDRVVTNNVRARLSGRELKTYRPPKRRWGSVLGVQDDGLEVFFSNGRISKYPRWLLDYVLNPLVVNTGIYRGVRRNRPAV